jgi:autotransporter-associated beta strand protein
VSGTSSSTLLNATTNALSPNSSIYVGSNCILYLDTCNAQIAGLEGSGYVFNWFGETSTNTLTINNTTDKTFSGYIRDYISTSKVAIAKIGSGKLTLAGNSAYTGGTTVTVGTLQAGSTTAFSPNSVLAVNGGVVDLNGNNVTVGGLTSSNPSTGVVANNLPGTTAILTTSGDNRFDNYYGTLKDFSTASGGTLGLTVTNTKANPTGANNLFLCSSGNTYSGATNIVPGTSSSTLLNATTNALSPNSSIYVGSNCILYLDTYNAQIAGLEGSGYVFNWFGETSTNTLTINNTTDKTFSGYIRDYISTSKVAIAKIGSGKLTLSGNNTYTGGTTVAAGTLQAGSRTAFSPNSVLTVNGGVVDLNGNNVTIGGLTSSNPSTGVVANNLAGTTATLTSDGDTRSDYYYGTLKDSSTGSGGTLALTLTDTKANPNGANNLCLSNSGNTYSGATTLQRGTYVATLLNGVTNGLSPNSSINVGAGCTLYLFSHDAQIAGLEGVSTGIVMNWYGGSSTATLTINTTADKTFAGYIQDAVSTSKVALAKTGSGKLTLSGANTYTGGTTVNQGILQLGDGTTNGSISGNITDNATLQFNNGSAQTYSGSINGSGTVVKSGSGILTLSGDNSYTGDLAINAGTLSLGANNALPNASAVTVNNGILAIGGYSDTVAGVTLSSGSITGTGGTLISTTAFDLQAGSITAKLGGTVGLTKTGNGLLTLSGNNTYTGTTAINAGTLSLGANNALLDSSTVTVNGGILAIGGYSDTVAGVSLLSGSITGTGGTLTSTTAFDLQAGSVTAKLGGTVGLTKTGDGLLTLSGNNTYTGTTAINAGTLSLGANNVLLDSSTVTVNGGELAMGGYSDTVAGVTLSSGSTTGTDGTLTSTTAYNLQSGIVSANLGGNVGLEMNGSASKASVRLSGNNSYTGAMNINLGTLIVDSNTAIPANSRLIINGGTMDLNGHDVTVGGLTSNSSSTGIVANNLANTTATLTVAGDNHTDSYYGRLKNYSGASGGTLGLTVTIKAENPSGDYALCLINSANDYSGTTNVSANAYDVTLVNGNPSGGPGTSGLSRYSSVNLGTHGYLNLSSYSVEIAGLEGTGTILPGAGGAPTLTVNNTTDETFSGAIQGNVGLTKTGAGMLTLSGVNTYTASTTIDQGTLNITGTLTNSAVTIDGGSLAGSGIINGTVAAGNGGIMTPGNGTSPSILSIGAFSQISASVFRPLISSDAAGSGYDQVQVIGGVSLGRSTQLDLTGTRNTAHGNVLTLIQNDGTDAVVGTFAGLPEWSTVTLNGLNYHITYCYNSEAHMLGIGNDVALIDY